MPGPTTEVLKAVLLEEYRIPSITAYNRLEGSPRTQDVTRSLMAEVRDPLWMLTRQWQFGEFQGEDAATPVTARILGQHTPIDRVSFPGNRVSPYDAQIPLEVQVEREPLRGSLQIALHMARFFKRLMQDNGLGVHLDRLRNAYPLSYAVDPNDYEAAQLLLTTRNVGFDGFALLGDMTTPDGTGTRFTIWMNGQGFSNTVQQMFNNLAGRFQSWISRTYSQPVNRTAWLPERLEYQFAVASSPAQQKILTADQYHGGHVDWFSFDLNTARPVALETERGSHGASDHLVSFIPAPIGFKGMPNPRFWMLEEQQTDFGSIDASTTGLLHLLMAEFGLVYSNDWFMLPYPMDINTLCSLQGLTVKDVFGQHTLVRPAGKGSESVWQRWAMFRITDVNIAAPGASLFYLAPALTKTLEGEPLEQINFLRDEMANMVWGVEERVPSQAGIGVSGNEMAVRQTPPPPFLPLNDSVRIRYVAGTTVPDNWIPFIPVHMEGSDREIRLQRAGMPGAKGALGVVLKEKAAPYYIFEEEIPRAGAIVRRSFQRTRWLNGRTYLWIGRSKETGRGEGWSNLQFDQIKDIPQNLT